MNILINEPLSVRPLATWWRTKRVEAYITHTEWASEPQKHPFILEKQKKNCDHTKWRIMVKKTETHVKYEWEEEFRRKWCLVFPIKMRNQKHPPMHIHTETHYYKVTKALKRIQKGKVLPYVTSFYNIFFCALSFVRFFYKLKEKKNDSSATTILKHGSESVDVN